jgi:hypothetical protein
MAFPEDTRMTKDQKIIRAKAGVLELAKQLGNVSQASPSSNGEKATVLIAKIVGFDGTYHRFTGKVTIEKFEKDVRVEIFDDHATWEPM